MKKSLLFTILLSLGLNAVIFAQFTGELEGGISGEEILSLADDGRLIAGTNGSGVFMSSNNGGNWEAMNEGLSSTKVYAITIKSEEILFAGTEGGVFLFNGDFWTVVNNGLTNLNVDEIAINGDNIFAGTQGGGVFLSTDNGSNWTAVNNGLTNLNVGAIVINGDNIFAGTDGGVFLSTDNGSNWTAVNNGLSTLNVRAIAINGSNLFAGTSGGVFLSTDNGDNWVEVTNGLSNINITSLAIYGSFVPHIFAGTSGGGIFWSDNNGSSWKDVSLGLPINDVRTLAVNQDDFSYIYAGTWGSGVWKRLLSDFSTLTVSTDSVSIEALDYSTATFDVASNVNWSILSSEPWLTANPTGGMLNKVITLTAQENTINEDRIAEITVRGLNMTPDIPLIITVTQDRAAPELSVSTNTLTIEAPNNSTVTFDITSNTSWTVSSSETWLAAGTSSGSDNATITLTAQANISAATRTTILTVSGSEVPDQTITITQEGAAPELTVIPDTLIIAAQENSTETFKIMSNTSWAVSSSKTWLTASPNSGSDTATITITAQANTAAETRAAVVTISAPELPDKTVIVTQDGAPTLTVSTNTSTIAAPANSTTTFDVMSNTDWTVTSSETWLTASPNTGSDTVTITLTAQANTAAVTRAAVVTVTSTGVPDQTVMVVQNGVSVGINKPNSNSINIYPNPASEMLHIERLQRETTGRIYNANGQMIFSDEIGVENGEINVSELPSGLYILKMDVDEGVVVKRFMKK